MKDRTGTAPKIFSYEYYEKLHDLEQRHWWQAGMRTMAGQLLKPGRNRSTTRVLDAGCGTGSMLSWLGEQTGATIVATAAAAKSAQ